jgi:hypothetical protein
MPTALVVTLAVAIGWSLYLEAQSHERPSPFRLLHRQAEPPVELFVHSKTGTCFVGYQPGGLVVVDKTLCEGTWLIIPPIVPPISPER